MAKKCPAVIALAAVLSGILIADNTNLSVWLYFLFLIVLFPPILIFYYKDKPAQAAVIGLMCLAAFSAFGFTFRYKTFPPGHIRHYVDDDKRYTIYGTVDDWPEIRENRTSIYITVDSLADDRETIKGCGRLLVYIGSETTAIQYGDRISFTSEINSIKGGRNPTGMDYRRYLNLKGVAASVWLPHQYSIMVDKTGSKYYMRLVDKLRREITGTFYNTLDSESAALASGFLIGDTRDIPIDIYDLFRDSGTLHLLAVSGSNVALVVMLFVFLMRASRLTQVKRTIFLMIIIVLFSFLSYNQPSVVRASVMASLILIGRAFQRKVQMNNIIASAALIILLIEPTQLFDIGFRLSFITAWGLIFLVPKVTALLKPIHGRLYYKALLFPLIISVVAQLAALPMTAYYFQRMPLISPLSNLVIVPLVSIIVIGELILLLAAFILPIVGYLAGSLLNPLLSLTISLLHFFGSGETALIFNYHISDTQLLAYYIFLAAAFISLSSKRARRFLVIFILGVANIFLASELFSAGEHYRLTVFSVPGGIAAVNQVEKNQVVLSDLPLKDYLINEKVICPYLTNRRLDDIDIIALSNDYQTNREAAFMLSHNEQARVYVPAVAENLFYDIMTDAGQIRDSFRVISVVSQSLPDSTGEVGAFLTQGLLVYQFDSLAAVFIADRGKFSWAVLSSLAGQRQLVAIKAVIDDSDLVSISRQQFNLTPIIICNKISRSISTTPDNDLGGSPRYNIIQTSQVGALQLVIKNGRLVEIE